jgi:capsid protein
LDRWVDGERPDVHEWLRQRVGAGFQRRSSNCPRAYALEDAQRAEVQIGEIHHGECCRPTIGEWRMIEHLTQRIVGAWQVLRGFAATQDSRASNWSVSGGNATAEVGAAAPTVARRARDAVRNDPYAARIVDLWTGNAVGAGITTRWPDNPHAEAWRRWSDSSACDAEGRLDLYGLQALVMRAVVESGECFVRMLPADITPANPIGLRLQVLESDHLDAARSGMIEALVAQVRAGFVPQPEAVGAFGYDFRQAVQMIREANDALDDAGISLDTDPRRVAKSGAAQDAAQLAAIEIAATGAASPRAEAPANSTGAPP